MSREQQMALFTKKQMQFMRKAKNKADRDYQIMLWAGFLTGMRLANSITRQEYDAYYKDLQDLSAELDAMQEIMP